LVVFVWIKKNAIQDFNFNTFTIYAHIYLPTVCGTERTEANPSQLCTNGNVTIVKLWLRKAAKKRSGEEEKGEEAERRAAKKKTIYSCSCVPVDRLQ
jgi:hypothetical protein